VRTFRLAQRAGDIYRVGAGHAISSDIDEWHIFVWLELLVTAVFTLEYLLRIASWPNPLHYIFSFWGY
jgi:voltage-gated potassium channel